MSKLFQIYEENLSELERLLPELGEAFADNLTPRIKTQLRRCKAILSDVRWNYGPPLSIEKVGDDHTLTTEA